MLSIPLPIPFEAIYVRNGGRRSYVQAADDVLNRNLDPMSMLAGQMADRYKSGILLSVDCYRNFRALVDDAWNMPRR